MYHHIKNLLEHCVNTHFLLYETTQVPLERPKQKDFGHFATPIAFVLAKSLKKAPNAIAEDLCAVLREYKEFAKVEPLNGYINLTLSYKFLDSLCDKALGGQYFIPQDFGNNTRILLEFVSANPTGPLHIGHARGAIYGDSLKRIGQFLGYEIVSEYYINDAGNQIATLGLSVLLSGKELLGEVVEYPQEYYKGAYITDIARAALAHFGEEMFSGDSHIPTLSVFAKDLMLEEIRKNLKSLDIEFDHYVSEKELFGRWTQTLETLKAHNGVIENEGKLWLSSTQKGDQKDRVIVRENGEPTYLAGDIIYHQDKFMRNFTHYINIWGADHHGYITRVKASIEFLGYDSTKLEILLSQMVALSKSGQNYKMSKRAGNFILLRDVVEDIGSDALRFVFLTKRLDTHLEFDVDMLSHQDSSNPIFYINYANARIHTLLEKSSLTRSQVASAHLVGDETPLWQDLRSLVFNALSIHQILHSSFCEREIQKVCEYLKMLASDFHSFYNAYKILQSPHQTEILKALLVVSESITLGLRLIGIQAKIRM
ncbi:arginine--tRNA ligase [Helicobacter equorum]|uniref:arginine--tRNA ligase n=1 Tax=Helicobacter equorum TaxID=361872 RepID=UPI000CF0AEAB|nr:arginine--tRNA ligase [Helicobacter equorum]